jgi:hypothetical protein
MISGLWYLYLDVGQNLYLYYTLLLDTGVFFFFHNLLGDLLAFSSLKSVQFSLLDTGVFTVL